MKRHREGTASKVKVFDAPVVIMFLLLCLMCAFLILEGYRVGG